MKATVGNQILNDVDSNCLIGPPVLKATKLQWNSLKLGQVVNKNTRRHGECFLKSLFGFKVKKNCTFKTSYIFSILKIVTHRESGLPVVCDPRPVIKK